MARGRRGARSAATAAGEERSSSRFPTGGEEEGWMAMANRRQAGRGIGRISLVPYKTRATPSEPFHFGIRTNRTEAAADV